MIEEVQLRTVLKLGLLYGDPPQDKENLFTGDAPLFILEGPNVSLGLLCNPWSYVFGSRRFEEEIALSLTEGLHGHSFSVPLSVGAKEVISSFYWLGIVFSEPRKNPLYTLHGSISLERAPRLLADFYLSTLQDTKERRVVIETITTNSSSANPLVRVHHLDDVGGTVKN